MQRHIVSLKIIKELCENFKSAYLMISKGYTIKSWKVFQSDHNDSEHLPSPFLIVANACFM